MKVWGRAATSGARRLQARPNARFPRPARLTGERAAGVKHGLDVDAEGIGEFLAAEMALCPRDVDAV